MIYLLTATGLTPGGSSSVHIYKQTIHRTTQTQTIHQYIRVIPWHFSYNWGKRTENSQSG